MSSTNNANALPEIQDLLSEQELFSSLDTHFGLFIGRLARNHSRTAALAAALVSHSTAEGNICLDLAEYGGKPLKVNSRGKDLPVFTCPVLSDWAEQLMESGIVSQGEGNTPLVLAGESRLYLRRYWEYENSVIRFIRQRADTVFQKLDYARLGKDLNELFKPLPGNETDWQQAAALAAISRPFSVISGGPGTGKTSTVAKILALFIRQQGEGRQLRILLAAPTGKAAVRLQQAIVETGLSQTGTEPLQTATLHRMLGHVPHSPYFRHNADNPLEADIVVVDEASMVDLPLMAKLMQAVSASTRLILLGDRHQLASVQPGSVLGDLCSPEIIAGFSAGFKSRLAELTGNSAFPGSNPDSTGSSSLQDSFVELVHSYRFSPESSIAGLSKAVKDGDGDRALAILLAPGDESVAWRDISGPADLEKALRDSPLPGHFRALQQTSDPGACFALLDNSQILCGLRKGPYGADRINHLLGQLFARQTQNRSAYQHAGTPELEKTSLPVRPIMVTRNDYSLQLFNGDVGLIMADPEDRQTLRAFFKAEHGMLRTIRPSLLPGHESVFAMTVHKSQGSEFNRVVLILPDQDSPLLTRELIYTAITRAREKVEIWGRKKIFGVAVKRKIKRTSGLPEELRSTA